MLFVFVTSPTRRCAKPSFRLLAETVRLLGVVLMLEVVPVPVEVEASEHEGISNDGDS